MLSCHGESHVKDLINTPLNFLVPQNIQESLATFTVPDVYMAFQETSYMDIMAKVGRVITVSADKASLSTAVEQLASVSC